MAMASPPRGRGGLIAAVAAIAIAAVAGVWIAASQGARTSAPTSRARRRAERADREPRARARADRDRRRRARRERTRRDARARDRRAPRCRDRRARARARASPASPRPRPSRRASAGLANQARAAERPRTPTCPPGPESYDSPRRRLRVSSPPSSPPRRHPRAPTRPPVTSPERREANALYKEGVRLYNAGEYAGALDLFQRAYERYPRPRVEFSLATTLKQMGKTVDAANWYERFIDDPSAEPQLVSEARTLLTLLDAMVAKVDVSTDGAAAEIQLERRRLAIGARPPDRARRGRAASIVRGRRPGFVAEATAKVAAGADAQLTLHWTEAPSHAKHAPAPLPAAKLDAPPTDETPAPLDHPGHTRRVEAIASAGGGVILVGAAVLLELASNSNTAASERICPGFHCDDPSPGAGPLTDARALSSRARTEYFGGIAAGAVGAVAIGAGTYLWLTAPRDARVHLAPLADDHAVGLSLAGRF